MTYDIFHSGARVFCVDDDVSAPVGEGKVVSDYVDGLLDRVSLKLVVRGNDMNWIIVNSEGFASVCFENRQFFEKNLLDKLQDPSKLSELITANPDVSSVERRVGLSHTDYFHRLKNITGRSCVSSNPQESLREIMKPNEPYYLECGRVKSSFVAYQLC